MGFAFTEAEKFGVMELRVDEIAERLSSFFERHWLAIFNAGFGMYVALALLAPILMHLGHPKAAGWIYTLYHPLCHQLPERSYFLFGRDHLLDVYSLSQLNDLGYLRNSSILARKYFVGNASIGYKMAFCQRCFAIYTTFFLSGIAFGITGRRWKRLSFKAYLLFILPMGIDGGLQLIGLHESSWMLRTITGALFALATVWLTYPVLHEGTMEREERR